MCDYGWDGYNQSKSITYVRCDCRGDNCRDANRKPCCSECFAYKSYACCHPDRKPFPKPAKRN